MKPVTKYQCRLQNPWQLEHWVRELKRSRCSVWKVEEKAASRLPTKSGALAPVTVMTTVEADLPLLAVSDMSHRGCSVRASPVLKVVSSVTIVANVLLVGM